MCVKRQSILGAGKTPDWAGATPPLAAYSRTKTSWGRSSPVFQGLPAHIYDGRKKEDTCRSSTNHRRLSNANISWKT
jgi:hypothetical protein